MSKESKRTSQLIVQARALGSSVWIDKSGMPKNATILDAVDEQRTVERRQGGNSYMYRIVRRVETVVT